LVNPIRQTPADSSSNQKCDGVYRHETGSWVANLDL